MDFITRAFTAPIIRNSTGFEGFLLGGNSKKNTSVNANTALSISAVFNGIEQISNDIAKLPKGVYSSTDKGRERLNIIEDFLISKQPNPFITQFHFHKAMVACALLYGNAFAKKVTQNGRLVSIEKLDDQKFGGFIKVDGAMFIRIGSELIDYLDLIHIKGFSTDGIEGKSLFKYAAENMGAALAADKFANEALTTKGVGYGVIETDKLVQKSESKRIIEDKFRDKMQSFDSFKVAILDDGFKYKSIAITPQDAQLIDWKKISVLDVARWLNIAPHKIKSMDSSTNNNIETQSLEHVGDTIHPWVKQFEEEYESKFFNDKQREKIKVVININALFRTDLKSKSEHLSRMVNSGIYTPNEAREIDNFNKIDGLDEIRIPVNAQQISNDTKN